MTDPNAEFVSIDRARLDPGVLEQGRSRLREVCSACRAAEATFWGIDAEGLALTGVLNVGPTADALEGTAVPVTGSFVGLVAMTGHPTSQGPEAEYHDDELREKGATPTQAMIAAPVRMGELLGGVLSAINPESGDPDGLFSGQDLANLQRLADQLGDWLGEVVPSD